MNHDAEASSSSRPAPDEDAFDLLDPDSSVLDSDPLAEPISFKRKPKQSTGLLSQPARFLSSLAGSGISAPARAASPGLAVPLDTSVGGRRSPLRGGFSNSHKGGEPLDWYAEGPGRRVGYEDLTAIDWIFEYTKERQRQRVLASGATGLVGYVRQLLDASQVWVVLVLTGLATGAVAAGIDIVSDWLGDLKAGYCSPGPDGGAFYLNKGFCCFGYDEGAHCVGWTPWAAALGVTSGLGKWFVEYFFFVGLSVSCPAGGPAVSFPLEHGPYLCIGNIGPVCGPSGKGIRDLREAQRDT
jgi:chloride channel 3/4/5